MAIIRKLFMSGGPFLENAIVLRGASLQDFWLKILLLAAMGFGFFTLCALKFKQKVA